MQSPNGAILEEFTTRDLAANGAARGASDVSNHDLHSIEQATASLASEERFFKVFDLSPDPLSISRVEDGRFLYVNQGFVRVSGYNGDEVIGRESAELGLWADENQRATMFKLLHVQGYVRKHEAQFRVKSGEIRTGLFSAELMDFDGTPCVLTLINDITDYKRAEERLAQQAARERIVNRITHQLRKSLDADEVFRTAVKELGTHLDVDRCVLFMIDKDAGLARNVAEYTRPGMLRSGYDYSLKPFGNLIGQVKTENVIAVDDAVADPRAGNLYKSLLQSRGVKSILYAAIKDIEGELLGAFVISTAYEKRQWQESERMLASVVADQTGIAIRQAQLYERAENASTRERLINRLSSAIRSSLDLSEILHTATHELGQALGASRTYLRMHQAGRELSPVQYEYVAPGVPSIAHTLISFKTVFGEHLMQAMECVVNDDAANFTKGSAQFNALVHQCARDFEMKSQIICPLTVQGEFRGALCIHQTERVRNWTPDEIALVEAVAAQLATSIAQAELFELVQRAKHEWETTFDAMSDGVFIFDKDKRLIRVNRLGAKLEDSYPHLLLGRRCCDIMKAASTDTECIVERTIAEGRAATIEVTPERLQRPLLVTVAPVFENNHITNVVCTVRDLTELREVEALARERQSLLVNVLESAAESIFAIDPQGYFQWCNSAMTTVTGYATNEIVGHHYLELIDKADAHLCHSAFERALNNIPSTYEVHYRDAEDNLRCALVNKSPLKIDGRITGVLGISRDITEEKVTQERVAQSDKLRALGQLASGVAHDFNNSLAAILGRAQLLRRQTTDAGVQENLDVIQKAAEDAAATVRRIQTFARQTQVDDFISLNVQTLLRDAVEITRTRWQNEARAKGLSYQVELDATEPLPASGNPSELREIFVNLIVNAIDAMPRGGNLTIRGKRKNDARIEIEFADTGAGMNEAVRERIFEPFYTTKGVHGTGLGLFVSYGIIERHGGRIDVRSQQEHGTTFTLQLPLNNNASPLVGNHLAEEVSPVESLSVLIVDDEDFVRSTLADMVTAIGHEVTEASSGQDALKRISTERFDLVFTDLSMPEMDGWELAREIRRRQPQTTIVMVTGYGATVADAPAFDASDNAINEIIGKPFDFKRISDLLVKFGKQEPERIEA